MKKFVFLLGNVAILGAGNPQIMRETQIPRIADPFNTGLLDKTLAFSQYRKEIKEAANENLKIPQKDESVFRVMTYNVHFWRNPENTQGDMNKMIQVIKKINPDIVILQEVSPYEGFAQGKYFTDSATEKSLKSLGFNLFSACNTVKNGWFGNVIASKSSFKNPPKRFTFDTQYSPAEQRCFVVGNSQLSNGADIVMYGTHLEVYDDNNIIRSEQMKQITNYIDTNLKDANVLIAGDFNASRTSKVVRNLQRRGYQDCFSYLASQGGIFSNVQSPTFTSWAGTEIDFIFLSPGWSLPLAGCYVYFDDASDHLPLIMDIALDVKVERPQPIKAPAGDLSQPDTNFLQELLQTLQRDFILLVQLF